MKILFFDDDEFLRNMYEVKLKQAGFAFAGYEHPTVAGNPIELVLREKPDLISTDIIHPGGLDGFEFIKLLKNDVRTKDIPVICLTNFGEDQDVKRGLAMGAADYLVTGSTTPSELVDKIRKILGLPSIPKSVYPTVPPAPNYKGPSFFDVEDTREKLEKKDFKKSVKKAK